MSLARVAAGTPVFYHRVTTNERISASVLGPSPLPGDYLRIKYEVDGEEVVYDAAPLKRIDFSITTPSYSSLPSPKQTVSDGAGKGDDESSKCIEEGHAEIHLGTLPDFILATSRPAQISELPNLTLSASSQAQATLEINLRGEVGLCTEAQYTAVSNAVVEASDNNTTHSIIFLEPTPRSNLMDPFECVSDLVRAWEDGKDKNLSGWPETLMKLLDLADQIVWKMSSSVSDHKCPLPSQQQCLDMQSTIDHLLDGLEVLQQQHGRHTAQPRSADGITQVDSGVFPLFEGCRPMSLEQALQGIDLSTEAEELGMEFWMCPDCERPTSEDYATHYSQKHRSVACGCRPPLLTTAEVLQFVDHRAAPATTSYTLESAIYRRANKAMREFQKDPAQFDLWRSYSFVLHQELQQLQRCEGSVYRAIDFRVSPTLYRRGNVVTWNQPSSASEDPRVARHFLKNNGGGPPIGTIFIIHSVSGRPIWRHSVHEEEREVVFVAGTQFQVVSQADMGLKQLLEAAMRNSMKEVDVYELRELTLDSWRDVQSFVDAPQVAPNRELWDLIAEQPTELRVCRNQLKEVCDPMSVLLRREGDGATALHLAAGVPDNLKCLQLVCSGLETQEGAAKDMAGNTALQVAIKNKHHDAAVFLLQRFGGWADLSQLEMCSVLPWLCAAGTQDLLEPLCDALHIGDERQRATKDGIRESSRSGFVACIEVLVRHNADVQAIDDDGSTALMLAAENGNVSCIEALLGRNADVQAASNDGRTALMFAARNGHVSCIETLVGHNADVQVADGGGCTALMLAARNGHVSCIEALAGLSKDVRVADHDGRTALMCAAENGHVFCIEALVGHNADVRAAANDGWTALMLAALDGHVSCIDALVARNADVRPSTTNGRTALMFAARNGHVSCIEALVGHNADVQAADKDGSTALMFATQNGHVSCMEALLGYDANV